MLAPCKDVVGGNLIIHIRVAEDFSSPFPFVAGVTDVGISFIIPGGKNTTMWHLLCKILKAREKTALNIPNRRNLCDRKPFH